MGIKKGFTFIEMVVVIGILSLILPALFAIVFTILQQQTKIIRLSEVKKQGDFVFNTIENTLRSYATAIYSDQALLNVKCGTAGTSWAYPTNGDLYFKDRFGNWFRYYITTASGANYIASSSAVFSTQNLTSNNVIINNFTIGCTRSASYSPPMISVSFQVQYKTSSTRPEDTALLNYQTSIKLRSY